MSSDYRAINTLVLVENAQQANSIAIVLRQTGIAVQQSWVTLHSDFSIALQRDAFDLGIIYCDQDDFDLPSSISRYPDIPFLAILDRYKNRAAEKLLDHGVADVAGMSQPVRLHRVLQRLLSEAALRQENTHLRVQQKQQDTLIHSMLQHSAIAVAYLHQGVHSYANANYQQLTGLLHLEEVQQTPFMDLIVADDRKAVASMLREIEAGDKSQANLDVKLQRPDGNHLSVDLELVPSFFDGEAMVQLTARLPTADSTAVRVTRPGTPPEIPTNLPAQKPATVRPPAETATHHDCSEKFDATLAIAPKTPELSVNVELIPMNNLRRDVRERLLVSVDQAITPDRLPGIDFGAFDLTISLEEHVQQELEQDRRVIDQSLNWLQQHLAARPNAQLFVPITAPVSEHGQLTVWLEKQLHQRALPASALALILRYDADQSAAWQRLATALSSIGIIVCAAGMSDLAETEAITNHGVASFAFLNYSTRDLAQVETLSGHIQCCRAAQIKTVTNIKKPADIANVWKSGLDCYVDQSNTDYSSNQYSRHQPDFL